LFSTGIAFVFYSIYKFFKNQGCGSGSKKKPKINELYLFIKKNNTFLIGKNYDSVGASEIVFFFISCAFGGQFVTRDLEGVFYWSLDFGWRQVKRPDWSAYPTPAMAGGLFSIRNCPPAAL
jgi:hypothetical protein